MPDLVAARAKRSGCTAATATRLKAATARQPARAARPIRPAAAAAWPTGWHRRPIGRAACRNGASTPPAFVAVQQCLGVLVDEHLHFDRHQPAPRRASPRLAKQDAKDDRASHRSRNGHFNRQAIHGSWALAGGLAATRSAASPRPNAWHAGDDARIAQAPLPANTRPIPARPVACGVGSWCCGRPRTARHSISWYGLPIARLGIPRPYQD